MNLENNIKDVIGKKLEDGTVEKLISEQLEKGILNALDNMFRSYGDVTKVIEEKIKSVMVPYIEDYDYSKYITKLDTVLVDVLKNSALENKKILSNFKSLITIEDRKTIKVTELFNTWMEYVEDNVETDDLEVSYDDEPSYESIEVTFEVEEDDSRSWSSFEYSTLRFECGHDEKMNFEIKLSRWKDSREKTWDIQYKTNYDIGSLRYLNEFEVFLTRLSQARVEVEIDSNYDSADITPNKEPEASWS